MTEPEQQFMNDLARELGSHPDKKDILAEYEGHLHELLEEVAVDKKHVYEELVNRLGSPLEISKLWKREVGITPRKTQWLFVICNIAIFIGGTILTISYNYFHWSWLEHLWSGLTEAVFIVMLVYVLFWGLLGYEIGKEFGHRGYRLLRKTFLIAILPNLLIMYLITFKLLPHEWFHSLLSFKFILLCIIFTSILYPVSWIGYRWGRKVSI